MKNYEFLKKIDYSKTIFEIEGVLCNDFSNYEESDSYLESISNADLLFFPDNIINLIVTKRKERYRKVTEKWLDDNNIRYRKLVMMSDDDDSAECIYKLMYYFDSDANLFIDSNVDSVKKMSSEGNMSFYCVDDGILYKRNNVIDIYLYEKAKERFLYNSICETFLLLKKIQNYLNENDVQMQDCINYEQIIILPKIIRSNIEGIINYGNNVSILSERLDILVESLNQYINSNKYAELTAFYKQYDFFELENIALLVIFNKIREVASKVDKDSCDKEICRKTYIKTKRLLYDGYIPKEHILETKEYLINWKYGNFDPFLGDFVKKYSFEDIVVYRDDALNMLYVIHNEKALYINNANINFVKMYYSGLLMEQDINSPHRYFTEKIYIPEKSVFLDIGAAEGIMSLEAVDLAEEVYVLEYDACWIKALRNTFKDYSDKVHIISKYAGMISDESTIAIDDLLREYKDKDIVIKLDVEGMELEVLRGAIKTLNNNRCKIVCATYHYHSELDEIINFFDEVNYDYEISDGYMVFDCVEPILRCGKYERSEEPDFRRGLVRAYSCGRSIK